MKASNASRTKKPKRGFLDGYKTYDPVKDGFGSPEQWTSAFRARMGLDEAQDVLGRDDPFTVLGLAADAVWSEIKAAYRKLALKFHPDINKAADAVEQMKRINAAYTVLEDRYKV